MIYTAEKSLKDAEGKVSDEDKKAVEEAMKALREKLDSADAEELKKLTDELSGKLTKIGEAMYKEAGAEEKKPEEGTTEDKKDSPDVEEGEVVDEKK